MKEYPMPEDTVRGDVIISISKLERLDDGKIKLTFLSKCNMFMNVPKAISDPFLAKTTKTWYDSIKKHYMKNHKKLWSS